MKKSLLGAVALGVGGAAVAGFGASAGRDFYRSVKKSIGGLFVLFAVAGAVFLPFLGMRNLFRGYAPGEWWKSIGDILLVPAGMGLGIGVAMFAGLMGLELMTMSFVIILGGSTIAAVTGIFVGLVQRPRAKRRYAIALRNEEFLASHGIHETGEVETTHFDADGNALRLMERTPNSIVFMAVGKRNRRAYIELTKEGEMIGYTGVVPLGPARNTDTAA